MEQTEKLFNALVTNNAAGVQQAFQDAMGEKIQQAYDIRKVNLTSTVFNSQGVSEAVELEEALSAKDFLNGGETKISDSDVDDLLGKIYDSGTLTKALVRNKAYQDGEDNPKKKNTYKKGTADFHLFQLGQQIQQSRS